MNDTIKGAIVGALITAGFATATSIIIFHLGNYSTQATLEAKTVETLSEYFDTVDKDMSYKEALQALYEGYINIKNKNDELINEKTKLQNDTTIEKEQLNNEIIQLKDQIGEMQSQLDIDEKNESIIYAANSYAESDDYEKALSILINIEERTPEMELLITKFSKEYELQVILQVSDLQNEEKYDDAIAAIDKALKVLPNNSSLISKKESINSKKPRDFMTECHFYETYLYTQYDTQYLNGEIFSMSGQSITSGFTLRCFHRNDGYAISNIGGKYNEISFDVGHVDGTYMNDVSLYIYLDGVLYQTYNIKADSLTTPIKIPVVEINQIKFLAIGDSTIGFANVTIK